MRTAAREREFPAGWLGSVLLHGGLAAAVLISWPWNQDMQAGTVVPVTIVTNAPRTDLRPAIQADQETTVQTETPEPSAPLEITPAPVPDPAPPTPTPPAPAPPKPAPTPKPSPPQPKPAPPTPAPKTAPEPTPKAPAPKPVPPKTAPARQPDALDLDALARDLAKARPSGGRPSSAARGETRAETSRQARPDAGEGLAASSIPGLQERLEDVWNPNCDVAGGRDARVRVTFVVGPGGQVTEATAGGMEFSSNGVVRVAAERAIRAVRQASPLTMVPRANYGKPITANFDPSRGCSA